MPTDRLLAERPLTPDRDAPPNRRAARSVTVNLAESPLGWLAARGLISARQFEAGEVLRRDYESANLGPRVTMRWDAAPAGTRSANAPDLSSTQIGARARFDAALRHAGSGLADVLWRVVCACEPLPAAEKSLGWPVRSGRVVLTLALDRIADYYRVA